MPKFQTQQLGYGLFTRSSEAPKFERITRNDSFVCWIDLLGVRDLPHTQIVQAVRRMLMSASECSATGLIQHVGPSNHPILIGTPQAAVQYSIVGDAIILVEKEMPSTPAAATLGLIYRANLLSRFLFEENLLHRGVITRGAVHCEKFDDANVITGEGVVNAFKLETTLKSAGIFFDQNTLDFINTRQQQIDKHSFCVPLSQIPNWDGALAPGLAGVSFSQYDGWLHWTTAIAAGNQSYSAIRNAGSLIKELKNTYNLP